MDFNSFETDPTAPVTAPVSITPSDVSNLVLPIRGFHVGVTGNVTLTAPNGAMVTYVGLQSGVPYPYAAVKIWSTGTTATNLVGFTS